MRFKIFILYFKLSKQGYTQSILIIAARMREKDLDECGPRGVQE